MRFLFLLLFLWPLASFGKAAVFSNKLTLRVLTYNIKGLPTFAAPDYDEDRYADIGRILARRQKEGTAPDLVLLQESFVVRTKELRDHANYPHIARGPDEGRGIASLMSLDSGLYILSRYPIVKEETKAFGTSLCSEWDCYANKGVQFARLQIPGLPFPIDIYNTHLQASRSQDEVRVKQVDVLANFIASTHKIGLPLIFAGDFNFRPAWQPASYRDFVRKTALYNVGERCLAKKCKIETGTDPERVFQMTVDHHFTGVEHGQNFQLTPLSIERTFAEPVKGRRLSDHAGLETIYELKW